MHWILLTMHKSLTPVHVNLIHASQIVPQKNTKSTMIYFVASAGEDVDYIQVQETLKEIFAKEVINV